MCALQVALLLAPALAAARLFPFPPRQIWGSAMPVLFGNFLSPSDLLVVAVLAFLFFGNRLPTMMRSLGEGVTEFKKGLNGADGDEPRRI
jgi:sec-independent protein translocase protein TatA